MPSGGIKRGVNQKRISVFVFLSFSPALNRDQKYIFSHSIIENLTYLFPVTLSQVNNLRILFQMINGIEI